MGDGRMTKKRFEVHRFIEGFPVAVDLIDSYAKELVEQGKDLADVTIDIHDNYRKQINGCGKNMTLKECCDLLNELNDEKEQLQEENTELKNDNKRMVKFIMSKGFSLKDYLEWLNEEVWK